MRHSAILTVPFFYLTQSTTHASASASSIPPICPKTFDGRIPANETKFLFTSPQSPFNPKYVLGQNVTWDRAISFPTVPPSLYDVPTNGKPIELEITDASIFASSSEGLESALRRAELLVKNIPSTVSGRVTWFLSLRTSSTYPQYSLNYTHEYLLAFHEAQDYQADFWSLKTGVPMVKNANANGTTGREIDKYGEMMGFVHPDVTDELLKRGEVLYLQGHKHVLPPQIFFIAPFTPHEWHNFGLHLNFDENELQVLYSTGQENLKVVTGMLKSNLSGKAPTTLGETHFGIQKKPVGANLTDFLYGGTQEWGIRERLVMGGIWQVQGHPADCGMV